MRTSHGPNAFLSLSFVILGGNVRYSLPGSRADVVDETLFVVGNAMACVGAPFFRERREVLVEPEVQEPRDDDRHVGVGDPAVGGAARVTEHSNAASNAATTSQLLSELDATNYHTTLAEQCLV